MSRTSVYVGRFFCCIVGISFASEVPTCSSDNTPWTEAIDETDSAIQMVQVKGYKVVAPSTSDQGINSESDDIHDGLNLAEVAGTVGLNFFMKGNLTENLVVDENEIAPACNATLHFGGSIVVVLRASTYHLGDFAATTQNQKDLSPKMTKLVVSANCQAILYTGLEYAGKNATFKAGTHMNFASKISADSVLSVRLKALPTPPPAPTPPPGPLPLTGIFKEFPKCSKHPKYKKDMKFLSESKESEAAMQRMMRDKRKCTLDTKVYGGACREKGQPSRNPSMCITYPGMLKEFDSSYDAKKFTKEFCVQSCLQMKALGMAFNWHSKDRLDKGPLASCECMMPGPRMRPHFKELGVPCPCGWRTQHGSDRTDPPPKRGELVGQEFIRRSSVTIHYQCVNIACDGPEPTRPPIATPAPAPLVGMFATFPKCKEDAYKYQIETFMQRAMQDKRKCTLDTKVYGGACREKGQPSRNPSMCATYPGMLKEFDKSYDAKKFTKEFCVQSCLQMKALGVAFNWHSKDRLDKGPLASCECMMPGPRSRYWDEERGHPCPCGWRSQHGSDKKDPPPKRGELVGQEFIRRSSITIHYQCVNIACNGPDPKVSAEYEVDWYHPAPRGPLA